MHGNDLFDDISAPFLGVVHCSHIDLGDIFHSVLRLKPLGPKGEVVARMVELLLAERVTHFLQTRVVQTLTGEVQCLRNVCVR